MEEKTVDCMCKDVIKSVAQRYLEELTRLTEGLKSAMKLIFILAFFLLLSIGTNLILLKMVLEK